MVLLCEWRRKVWVGWESGLWLAERFGRIRKVGWWWWRGDGRQGQEEPMEMQIASLNSIAGLSFDVK